MDNLIAALHDELHDVMKYVEMSKHCDYGSILCDIAHEEMQHAKNIEVLIEMNGGVAPDMSAEWQGAKSALLDC